MKITLLSNVLSVGSAGESVDVHKELAEGLLRRGLAAKYAERPETSTDRGGGGAQNPPPAAADDSPIEWPENTGVFAEPDQVEAIALEHGLKPDWLHAAASVISDAGGAPTVEVLEVIAGRSKLRKEVLNLADVYAARCTMAAEADTGAEE